MEPGRRIELVDVTTASASFQPQNVERIVLTSTEAADGLVRLAVLMVGMDGDADNDETRSLIFRGLTRAQLVA